MNLPPPLLDLERLFCSTSKQTNIAPIMCHMCTRVCVSFVSKEVYLKHSQLMYAFFDVLVTLMAGSAARAEGAGSARRRMPSPSPPRSGRSGSTGSSSSSGTGSTGSRMTGPRPSGTVLESWQRAGGYRFFQRSSTQRAQGTIMREGSWRNLAPRERVLIMKEHGFLRHILLFSDCAACLSLSLSLSVFPFALFSPLLLWAPIVLSSFDARSPLAVERYA